MKEMHFIESPRAATELLNPIRVDILTRLDRPRTCTELAKELGLTTQKVNYHMNVLLEAGLVTLVEERRKRGTIEGIYRAAARSIWFSPRLVSRLGGRRPSSDEASLAYLLELMEQMQIEIGHLADRDDGKPVPSLAFDAQIELADADDRNAFYEELHEAVKKLAGKYGRRNSEKAEPGRIYRFALACYPKESKE